MSKKTRWLRFLIGFACTLAVVIAGFSIVMAAIPSWGATPAETRMALPGDERIPQPAAYWTVVETVNAPAEDVYPWLVQIGDNRAGFYSYMFIEKLFDPKQYNNADRVHPEWQNPEKGLGVIADMVAVEDYQPGSWFLVNGTEKLGDVKWTWVWKVEPIDANSSRLINRFKVGVPQEIAGNPIIGFVIFNGGFVMEQNMMQGIAQRAEGRGEFAYIEPVEIVLWLAALLAGLWAARSFLVRPNWQLPLVVGLLTVVWLFVLTFVQPAIWVRLLGDAAVMLGAAAAAGYSLSGRAVVTRPAATSA